jgi:hypothetical protein
MSRTCSTHGEKGYVYRILVGKSEGKRPPGRSRHKWDDSSKMDLKYDWVVWTAFIYLGMGIGGELLRTK